MQQKSAKCQVFDNAVRPDRIFRIRANRLTEANMKMAAVFSLKRFVYLCFMLLVGQTNIMLSTFESQATVNAAAVNPYWMNPMYQRPAPASASDLGYSTMTPHGGKY